MILLRIAAFILRRRVVMLMDFEQKIHFTMTKPKYTWWDGFVPECHVYPFARAGHVTLQMNGATSGDSHYIKKWRYV